MTKHINTLCLLLFLAAIGFRIALFFVGGVVLTICFYVAFLLGFVMLGIDSMKPVEYANAYSGANTFHLNVLAFVAGVGMFVDFISDAIFAYKTYDSGSISAIVFVPLCVSCFLALLSSFYFIMLAISFGSSNYDFRQLKLLHIVPLLWSISRLMCFASFSLSLSQNDGSILKLVVLVFAIGAFFSLSFEVENKSSLHKITMLFIRALYYSGTLYFINELMLLLGGSVAFSYDDGLLSVSLLFISAYMFFLEKSIISNSKLEV